MMKKNINHIALVFLGLTTVVLITFGGCKKTYEEERYQGKVIQGIPCSSKSLGYLIELETPKNIGDTATIDNIHYKNVVIGYKAPKLLKDEEEIHGVLYKIKGYAAINCIVHDSRNLQEVIILSVEK